MTDDLIAVIIERINNLDKKSDERHLRAEKWREHFDAKLDARPCEQHRGFFKAIDLQLKAIWTIIVIVIAELIREHFTK